MKNNKYVHITLLAAALLVGYIAGYVVESGKTNALEKETNVLEVETEALRELVTTGEHDC